MVVGVIVGVGAEGESVLRPDCLPSGGGGGSGALPTSSEVVEKILLKSDKNRHGIFAIKVLKLLRHCHVSLFSDVRMAYEVRATLKGSFHTCHLNQTSLQFNGLQVLYVKC